jgi:hypothetical protein
MTTILPILLAWVLPGDPAAESVERLRYLRPSGERFVLECELTLRWSRTGSSVESTTIRGNTRLTVTSHYDEQDRLTRVGATLVRDGRAVSATVSVSGGTARVRRAGQEEQAFEVPPGVIVTSAPDWTDVVLLCRRYDRTAGGKQSFPGLWIHPEQAGQRLTFGIERTGKDVVETAGKKIELDRYTIRLRGNSGYVGWADQAGKLIKLVPSPARDTTPPSLVLDHR